MGNIGGWGINSTQIYKDPIFIDSEYKGIYINDLNSNKIVEMADQEMAEITGSENILLNRSFEDGSSGQDVSIPDWYYESTGELQKFVTGSIWGQSAIVHGNKSVVFAQDLGSYTSGTYELLQDLTGSFLANESIYALLFSKLYYSNQDDISRNGSSNGFALYYSSSAVGDWTKFYPTDEDFQSFYLGKEFTEYSYISKLPANAEYIRLRITGSLDQDDKYYPDSQTAIIYDYFQVSVERPRVQMLPDGLLIYGSPKSYIKLTADGLDIKGGNNFEVNSVSAGNIGIGGLLASNGSFQGTTIPPMDSAPLPISQSNWAGSVINYARGNHQHELPFGILNSVIGESTIDNLYVDKLYT